MSPPLPALRTPRTRGCRDLAELDRLPGARTLLAALTLLLASGPAPAARAQADGTPKWPSPFVTGGYLVSSPAVAPDGTVYIGSQDKHLYAIAPNGALKWRFQAGDWIDATPAIGADGTVYVGSWDGFLYALAPDHGTVRWRYSTGAGNYIYSSPAIGADGTIYFGAGDGNLHALRPDGGLKWTYPAGDWIDSSPAIGADGLVYYGSWDGFVQALRDEGDRALEVWRYATNGPVLSSPALGRGGTVLIGSNDGRLHALDAATGHERWTFRLEGDVEASPAVGPDGTIYVGGATGYLHALTPGGALRWRFPTGDPILSTPTVRADGTILVGSGAAALFAITPEGTLKWKATAGDWVDSSPAVAPDGTIYVGSYDRRLYAFHGSGAPASSYASWPMFRRDPLRRGRVSVPAPGGRLVNLSTRAEAGARGRLIAGFVVEGAAGSAKSLLVRGIGPALARFGVAGFLADPLLELIVPGDDQPLASNDHWSAAPNRDAIAAAATRTGAFPLPESSLDAALLTTVAPRPHTALVTGVDQTRGLALVEVYDADLPGTGSRLINLSARAFAGEGDAALTPGLVIGGSEPLRVLVRGVGPALTRLGVEGALARPTLTLFSGPAILATNSGWTAGGAAADLRAAAAAVGAFPFDEASSDAALLATLAPGAYTVRLAGAGGTTGEALVEIYVVP